MLWHPWKHQEYKHLVRESNANLVPEWQHGSAQRQIPTKHRKPISSDGL